MDQLTKNGMKNTFLLDEEKSFNERRCKIVRFIIFWELQAVFAGCCPCR